MISNEAGDSLQLIEGIQLHRFRAPDHDVYDDREFWKGVVTRIVLELDGFGNFADLGGVGVVLAVLREQWEKMQE